MAIFYNHIKGCGANTTGTNGPLSSTEPNGADSNESWGWITWPNKLKYVKHETETKGKADFRYINNCPELRFNNINSKPTDDSIELSLGKFILSHARYQYIAFPFYFNENVQIKNSLGVTNTLTISNGWLSSSHTVDDTKRTIELSGNYASVWGVDTKHHLAFINQSALFFFDNEEKEDKKILPGNTANNPNSWGRNYGAIYKQGDTLFIESTQSDRTAQQKGYFAFSEIKIINHDDKNDATLLVDGKCEALYFNATSDRRAKTNITPVNFSALQVVNSLPTYTFNYKGKEEKTLGLIAQEAAEFDLDGFNMVDNLEAIGQDGDFMQMKESKLVYVLWKAVQELSAEVEDLKSQIASLK